MVNFFRYSSHNKFQAGFTVIELSVVLVIIGLILAAVMSGRDVVSSAEGKKAAAFVSAWADLQWEHYDRYGRFAGDYNSGTPDRLIDNQVPPADAAGKPWPFYCVINTLVCDVDILRSGSDISLARGFTQLPGDRTDATLLTVGSFSFYVSMGVDVDTATNSYNVILVTIQRSPSTAIPANSEYFNYLAQIDTAIDGAEGPGTGRVRAVTAPFTVTNRTVNGTITQSGGPTGSAALTAWSGNTATSIYGLVYYFDKQP